MYVGDILLILELKFCLVFNFVLTLWDKNSKDIRNEIHCSKQDAS